MRWKRQRRCLFEIKIYFKWLNCSSGWKWLCLGLLAAVVLGVGMAAPAHAEEFDFFVEAVRKNQIEEVRNLIRKGADVNSKDAFGDNAGLHWAALQGLEEMARLLIDNGADLDIANSADETPLHWAAKEGQKQVLVILIVHGADVNARTRASWTPLRWAEAHGYKEIANILKAAGGHR
jgi:ankyrin repeat protein